MTDETAQWWYENNGQPAGPISAAMLHGLIQSGQVRPTARVWRAGMAGWQQIASLPELASLAAGAPPPPAAPRAEPPLTQTPDGTVLQGSADAGATGFGAPAAAPSASGPAAGAHGEAFGARPQPAFGPGPARPGSAAPQPRYAQGAPGAPAFEEVSIGVLVLLTIVTLGIYGVVKFYQTGKAYEQLAGRESRFSTYFWLYVGLGAGSVFVRIAIGHLGWAFHIASIVFGILTLFEALAVRDEGLRRYELTPPAVTVTSDATHKVLYILGVLLSIAFIGVILLIVQAVKWFEDWNTVVRGLGARRF